MSQDANKAIERIKSAMEKVAPSQIADSAARDDPESPIFPGEIIPPLREALVAGELFDAAHAYREAVIERAIADGVSDRKIAKAVRLTHPQIARRRTRVADN